MTPTSGSTPCWPRGGTGLSTAFDLPTLMGRDSDDPLADGEVGKCGVAVDTLADVRDLFAGVDLGAVTTSMTINSPAAILLAMYVATAELDGTPRAALGGTLQNDILKEYQAQKEFVFPPRPSMRLVRDTITFCQAEMPRWHPISISGYHIREAGSTAAQELAFTLANGFAYVELALAAGLAVDAVRATAQLLLQRPHRLLRGDRQVPRRRAASGPAGCASATAPPTSGRCGCASTPRRPGCRSPRSSPRSTSPAPRSRRSPACSAAPRACTPTRWTRRSRCPPRRPSRIALRTQQVIAHETGVADVIDPLGGSWFVESLTDEMEQRAEEIFAHLDDSGSGSMLDGVLRGIDEGWFQGEIADSAYELERALQDGRRVVVGVNAFTEGNDEAQIELLRITHEQEQLQVKRLGAGQGRPRLRRGRPHPGPGGRRRRRSRGQPHAGAARRGPRLRHRGRDHHQPWPTSSGATPRPPSSSRVPTTLGGAKAC